MFETIELDQERNTRAKIKVVGVGGAGGNAVNRMVSSGFTGVEFISVNTDAMALENSSADNKIPLGSALTKGLGAGAKPEVGHDAILESKEEVKSALEGADMVFITAGMGGGTGTGAAPIVAELCKEMGILSVAVVTRPFLFEGPIRTKNSLRGLDALTAHVDTIITIHNQKILAIADNNMSMKDAFASADDVLIGAVRGISEIILKHGEIQVDFADVKTIMTAGGDALMGTGVAEGENRAVAAAQKAIHSPLLDDIHIQGASGILVNITGGEDMGILEINEAMSYIYNEVGEDNVPNIIFGTVINPELSDEIQVTVIATGFRKNEKNQYVPKTGISGDDSGYMNEAPAPQAAAPQAPVQPEPTMTQPRVESVAPATFAQPQVQPQAQPSQPMDHQGFQTQPQFQQSMTAQVAPTAPVNPTAAPVQPQVQPQAQYQMEMTQVAEEVVVPQATQQASLLEKSELEMETQLAPMSAPQTQQIVEEMFEAPVVEEIIEEPIAIQSHAAPVFKANMVDEVIDMSIDMTQTPVEEEIWKGEVDTIAHPTPDAMPAYMRQENQINTAEVKQEEVKPFQSEIAPEIDDSPAILRQESLENQSPFEAYNTNADSDVDDDFETPAFLRSQDF